MAEPKKLTQKEYDAIRSDYEKRYGYDSRSPKEKVAFDKKTMLNGSNRINRRGELLWQVLRK